jgi:hypothetical protein
VSGTELPFFLAQGTQLPCRRGAARPPFLPIARDFFSFSYFLMNLKIHVTLAVVQGTVQPSTVKVALGSCPCVATGNSIIDK